LELLYPAFSLEMLNPLSSGAPPQARFWMADFRSHKINATP
jgi:hypothetical protein